MLHNDDFFSKWEHIVNEVSKTDVPLECLKKIVIKFNSGRQRTVNLQSLQKQGLTIEDIEKLVNKIFHELDSEIRDVDFVVDINAVASLVQPETDKLLEKL
jgi:benzoyl-CoA reductase/2-hydroxyglutaryl-CoA dehydratase subunit BcrC/BadD/HgdB